MRSLLHRYSDGKASLSSATRVFDSGRKNTLTFEQESHHYDGDDDARIKNSRSDFVAAPEIPKVLRDRDSGSSWRFASQAQTHSQRYAPYTKK
ncbi:unnamed protein product [Allacma fusca]|uniref:Uncharacterized protein n=1 Tax=Allacma fusca TaxID=39272 RepID=A0A8J2PSP4_9HEXA|nr:unnamed protein product [Allacma fusca]